MKPLGLALGSLLLLAAPASPQGTLADDAPNRFRPRSPWIALHAASGAVVGAWFGYMVSQVRYSDWDRDQSINLGDKRRWYTAYGAGVGSLAGLAFSLKIGTRTESHRVVSVPRFQEILRSEIEEAGSANAFDLVQTLRRNWLHERGTHSMRETTVAQADDNGVRVVRVGDPTIVVYLNDAFLGYVDQLREIPAVTVHAVRYFDATSATQRWGAGHTHGAIQVLTQEQP